ncbi:hypothetical protein [Varibaculum cambriense]|uniref:hypothetical protein n=1 Tax=Varibaculum cambriense TaxID=184870 RepID=UPI00290B4010|nr:hypothetical protein [Varibaculum cambriense]MDU5541288.1 hypothetical protein [Varibaculum cambriense]
MKILPLAALLPQIDPRKTEEHLAIPLAFHLPVRAGNCGYYTYQTYIFGQELAGLPIG